MNWSQVTGATGRCKVAIRNWTGRDGETKQSNEIKKFYDKDSGSAPQIQPAQGFKAGEF